MKEMCREVLNLNQGEVCRIGETDAVFLVNSEGLGCISNQDGSAPKHDLLAIRVRGKIALEVEGPLCRQSGWELPGLISARRTSGQAWSVLDTRVEKKSPTALNTSSTPTPSALSSSSRRPSHGSLINAVSAEEADNVRRLVEAGADVNHMNRFGDVPLDLAIKRDNEEIVEILVDGGADAKGKDKDGNPFIHLAIRKRNPEIVRVLVEAGANPNEKDFYRNPAIQVAIVMRNPEIVRILLSGGADANDTSYDGYPVIHQAIDIGAGPEIVKILVDGGADVNAVEKLGRFAPRGPDTALGKAVRLENVEITRMLVDAGADVHAKSDEPLSSSAAEIAARSKNEEVIEIIRTAASEPLPTP